jgi:ADP-heptose:LPS heptosyltransferase
VTARRLSDAYHAACHALGFDPRWRILRAVAGLRRPAAHRPEDLWAPSAWRRVLVVRKYGIGNGVCVTPVLAALRRVAPGARVTLAVAPTALELLDGSGLYDEAIRWPSELSGGGGLAAFRRAARRLRAAKFEVTFLAYPDDGEDVAVLRGFCDLGVVAGAPINRWGQRACDIAVLAESQDHEIAVHLRLLEALGVRGADPRPDLRLSPEETAWAREEMARVAPAGRPLVGLHPGAAPRQQYKAWPLERWEAVARDLDATVALFGGPEEVGPTRRLVAALGLKARDLVGRYPLRRTAALIGQCDVMAGGDTGLMHVARAVGVPVAVVFGPTDPVRVRPWGPAEAVRVLRPDLDCAPCARLGGPPPCANERACLRAVAVEDVLRAIRGLILA